MKILFVDQTGQLGGGELSLLDIVANTSHTSEVVLFRDGPLRQRLERLGVVVHLLEVGEIAHIKRDANPRALLRTIRDLKLVRDRFTKLACSFDLVYANSQKAFVVSALCLSRKTPLVWHLRDVLSHAHFSYSLRKLVTIVANIAATVVVANSRATRESFLQLGGSARKCVVVHNGIDPSLFEVIPQSEINQVRRSLALTNKFVVGSFGRLTSWKGQHVLIEAAVSLPTIDILVVGDALFGEEAYAETLKQQASALGVSDRVHFLGFRSDIPLLMSTVDIVVHTAISPEPFGRVLVEGMLARTPVIASNAGGTSEIIESGVQGLLIDPNSAAELAKAVLYIKYNPEIAQHMTEAGYRHALEHFTVTSMVKNVEAVLASIQDK